MKNTLLITPFSDGYARCCKNRVAFKIKTKDTTNGELIATSFVCQKHIYREIFPLLRLENPKQKELSNG